MRATKLDHSWRSKSKSVISSTISWWDRTPWLMRILSLRSIYLCWITIMVISQRLRPTGRRHRVSLELWVSLQVWKRNIMITLTGWWCKIRNKVKAISQYQMEDSIRKQTSLLLETIQEKVLLVNNIRLMQNQQNKKSLMKWCTEEKRLEATKLFNNQLFQASQNIRAQWFKVE